MNEYMQGYCKFHGPFKGSKCESCKEQPIKDVVLNEFDKAFTSAFTGSKFIPTSIGNDSLFHFVDGKVVKVDVPVSTQNDCIADDYCSSWVIPKELTFTVDVKDCKTHSEIVEEAKQKTIRPCCKCDKEMQFTPPKAKDYKLSWLNESLGSAFTAEYTRLGSVFYGQDKASDEFKDYMKQQFGKYDPTKSYEFCIECTLDNLLGRK